MTEPLLKTLKVATWDDRHILTFGVGNISCEAKERMMARAKAKRAGRRRQFKPNSHSASSVKSVKSGKSGKSGKRNPSEEQREALEGISLLL